RLYDVVEHRGGRGERGADFICRAVDPLGTQLVVAVQLKMWQGIAVDEQPLRQIRAAWEAWPGLTSGVVITTAEVVAPSFAEAANRVKGDLGIPVTIVLRAHLMRLFLTHLVAIVEDAGP